MAGKTLQFNKDVFWKLVKIMRPVYEEDIKTQEENFSKRNLDKKSEVDKKFIEVENSLESLKDEALFTIDGQIWTVIG